MDVNISEDLLNSDDNNNCFNIIKYPDVTGISPIKSTGTKEIDNNNYKKNYSASDIQLVDYEKTQEEQLKDQRNVPLPKTCDDFQRFSYMRDPTQPIYVQCGSETLYNVPSYPTHVDRSTIDTSLEPLFNMQTKTPLRQSNVNNTSLVFTMQTVPTALWVIYDHDHVGLALTFTCTLPCGPLARPLLACVARSTALPDPAGPADGALDVISPLQFLELCDLKMTDLIQSDLSSSSSVMPNTTDSLSEMFEDALQIVSQDSDHACSIHKMDKSKWNITYTLKSLMQCNVWLHRVIEYDDTLYLRQV